MTRFIADLLGVTAFALLLLLAPSFIQAAASFELFQDACGVGVHSPLYGGFYVETVSQCK